jgi:GNAT superfamily N-acetyltransferase
LFQIRPYRNEDEPHVLQLLHGAFGTWPGGIVGQDATGLFRWKHEANTFGRSVRMVAEAEGTLIGFAAWLRWRMCANGRTFEALRAVDVAVDRVYRGQGVYGALVRAASPHFPHDAAFTLSTPNELSRPGSLRVGGCELGTFPLFVRVPAPVRTAVGLIRRNPSKRARHESPLIHAEPAAHALVDDESVSSLLSAAEQSTGRFTTDKSLDYLRWRYGTLEDYRAVREHRDGHLVGIAIFRVRPRGRSWVSTVCELLIVPGDRAVPRTLLHRVVQASAVDYIICHFPPNSTARQAAIRCGFLRVRSGPVPTVRVLMPNVAPDPTEHGSWAICLGDVDLL